MQIQCQQVYPQRRRCHHPTHKDEQWCQWHKIQIALSDNALWLTVGPTLLVGVAAFSTSKLLAMFLGRIFFRKLPHLEQVLRFLALGLVTTAFQPVLDRFNPISLTAYTQFWQAVLGNNTWWPLSIAYFAAFTFCELVNVQMRRRNLDANGFQQTFLISYAVCALPPTLAMLASRFLLFWMGMHGSIPFIILTLIVSIPLCVIGTGQVIRSVVVKGIIKKIDW